MLRGFEGRLGPEAWGDICQVYTPKKQLEVAMSDHFEGLKGRAVRLQMCDGRGGSDTSLARRQRDGGP
jgi:hypothetical protein